MRQQTAVIVAVIVFFIISVFTAYFVITILPYSYYKQRAYSIPSNEANYTSSTMGGEALMAVGDQHPIPVFLGPSPGASNVSLDTVIYIYQPRPLRIELQLDPETEFARIENKDDPPASRNTIFYPAQLLQPNTTYNVSGSISGSSAWWTFTTASTFSQPEYEIFLTPHAWWISIIAASIASSIFAKKIWRSNC